MSIRHARQSTSQTRYARRAILSPDDRRAIRDTFNLTTLPNIHPTTARSAALTVTDRIHNPTDARLVLKILGLNPLTLGRTNR